MSIIQQARDFVKRLLIPPTPAAVLGVTEP
jgi:hypothetical protein